MNGSLFKLTDYFAQAKPNLRYDNETTLKMQSKIVILAAVILIFIRFAKTLIIKPLRHHLKSRRLGCGPVPVEPKRWPLGIDVVRRGLQADREQRTPDFVAARFEAMGRYTWGLSLLGTSNLITAEPRNVQALLATQFDEFIMGSARRTNLKTVLGRSIFAVDGKAWHSARETMRPLFSRENVSRLELLEQHVQTMLRIIETRDQGLATDSEGRAWSAPISLATLLPCLTMDSATELFLGQSTHSLKTILGEGHQKDGKHQDEEESFNHAFERMLGILGTRMRLRKLYWLYGNTELKKCVKTLHKFVDAAMDAADQARDQDSSQLRYDFLESLRARCIDRAEVREQVLGLLAAGRDTTASLIAWVLYCLVRHPRVYEKLRQTVLQTFGTYSTTSGGNITFEKLKACRYLQHIMSETLRLHSVVPFNSRCARRDTTLPTGGGPDGTMPVFVPEGTEVNFSTHVLHRRKDLWGEDADEFVPERWEKKRPGTTWQYIPFNGGPRICIGQQFALTEAGYVLVRMVQRYDIIEGLDIDMERDWHNFTIVCSPGSPVDRDAAVLCRLRVAID
jgi:cytochrome P450